MMKAGEVFSKTMGFVWAKLALGLVTVLISGILFALCMLIGLIGESVMAIMFIIWLGATGAVSFFLNNYVGYMVKAGHVAVITETIATGKVPEKQFEYAKTTVKGRFLTSNVYFGIDKLVSGAVKQIQRVVGKVTGLFGKVPGMDAINKVLDLFLNISLGYVDECCLGYTFYKKEQDVYKSAADGVVIYFQNWKVLLKNAAKTTVSVILVILVVTILTFVAFGGLFKIFGWSQAVAFILALFVAGTIKSAFVDSWGLVSMMTSYMQVVPSTEITFDLYNKLSGMSGSFKKLLGKSNNAGNVTNTVNTVNTASAGNSGANNDLAKFCPECGEKIADGTKFCGKCGASIEVNV